MIEPGIQDLSASAGAPEDDQLDASVTPDAGAPAAAPSSQYPVKVKLSDGSWKRVVFMKPPSDSDIDEAVHNFNSQIGRTARPSLGQQPYVDKALHGSQPLSPGSGGLQKDGSIGWMGMDTSVLPKPTFTAADFDPQSSNYQAAMDSTSIHFSPEQSAKINAAQTRGPDVNQSLDAMHGHITQGIYNALRFIGIDDPEARLPGLQHTISTFDPIQQLISAANAGTDKPGAGTMDTGIPALAKGWWQSVQNLAHGKYTPDDALGAIAPIMPFLAHAFPGEAPAITEALSKVKDFQPKEAAAYDPGQPVDLKANLPSEYQLAEDQHVFNKWRNSTKAAIFDLTNEIDSSGSSQAQRTVAAQMRKTRTELANSLSDNYPHPLIENELRNEFQGSKQGQQLAAQTAPAQLDSSPALGTEPPPAGQTSPGAAPGPETGAQPTETPTSAPAGPEAPPVIAPPLIGGPVEGAAAPAVDPAIAAMDELPGVRNLPGAMKAAAMDAAQKAGVTQKAGQTVAEYQQALQKMGMDSAKAARIAEKGKLTPEQVNYLGNLIPHVADARDAALEQVQKLTEAGASPEAIAKAQQTADTLADQHTQILQSFTGGSSDIGRGLRMLQELSRGVLDLSGVVKEIEKKTGSKVATKTVQALEKKLSALRDAQASAAAEKLPKPPEGAVTEPSKSGYGAANTIVDQDAYEAAKAAWKKKTLGRAGAGIPLDALPDLVKMGAYHVEAGVRSFADWSKAFQGDVGEGTYTDRQLKDVYRQSLETVAKKTMSGSQFAPDLLTRGSAGIQDPAVLQARAELLGEIRKSMAPSLIDTAGELARAHSLATVSVLSHILGAGPLTLAAKEVGRIPRSAINYVALALDKPIMRQGFSASDFMKSWTEGVPKGLQEAKGVLMDGRNSAAAAPEFFGGKGGLRQIGEDLKNAKSADNIGDRMNAIHYAAADTMHMVGTGHGALQQPTSFWPSYYRAIRDQATVFATNSGAETLKALDPSLSSLDGSQLKLGAKQWLVEHPQAEMVHAAIDDATKNSLMQNNKITEGMASIRNFMKQGGSSGKAVAALWSMFEPTTRPGSNVAFMTAEFSPIGLYRGGMQMAKAGDALAAMPAAERANIARLIDHGLTGTALMGLGYYLHQKGAIEASSEHGEGYKPQHEFDASHGSFADRVGAGDAKGAVGAAMGAKVEGTPSTFAVGGAGIPSRYAGIGGMLLQLGADGDRDESAGTSHKNAAGKMIRDVNQAMNPLMPTIESVSRFKDEVTKLWQSKKDR